MGCTSSHLQVDRGVVPVATTQHNLENRDQISTANSLIENDDESTTSNLTLDEKQSTEPCETLTTELVDLSVTSELVDLSHGITSEEPINIVVVLLEEAELQSSFEGTTTKSESITKSCCGKPCLRSSSLCCEHASFTCTSPKKYCQSCRAQYLEANDENGDDENDDEHDESATATTVDSVDRPCVPVKPPKRAKKRSLLPFEKLGQICQEECPVCLLNFKVITGALCILPCAHAICHSHRHKINACPLCRCPINESEAKAESADYDGDGLGYMSQTERYELMHSSE